MAEKGTAPQERGTGDLRQLFKRFGISTEAIAKELGVGVEVVEGWCNSEDIPTSHQSIKIARLLGCTLKEVYLAIICTPPADPLGQI